MYLLSLTIWQKGGYDILGFVESSGSGQYIGTNLVIMNRLSKSECILDLFVRRFAKFSELLYSNWLEFADLIEFKDLCLILAAVCWQHPFYIFADF